MPSVAEDLVEGVAELCVGVVDEKPERLLVAEPHDQVARLLGDPAAVRSRRAGDVLDLSRRERDEEEDVDPLQKGGFDGEEVAGEHARRPRSEEGSPRRVRSLWRRLEPASSSTLRREVAETRMPRPLSSPTIRL